MRAVLRHAAILMTASAGAGVLAAGMVVAGAGPAAASGQVLYAYAGGTASSPASCPQDTGSPPDPSAECSLSDALTLANAGDTIDLATPGATAHYFGNWSVGTLNTSATAPVTIAAAPGVSNPELDGNNGSPGGCSTTACNGPVLAVPSGEYVALSGITIANGARQSGFAGGLVNQGTVTISGSTFTGNGGVAGGLFNEGAVTVAGSTFTGNHGGKDAGAISNDQGTLSVTDSTFYGNSGGFGGAIGNTGGGTLSVTDSTFSANSGGSGGAIDNGDAQGSGTLQVTDSTFSGNSADDGGAIDNGDNQSSGTVQVTASTFSGNTASGDGGAIDNGDNQGSGTVQVAGDVFDGSCDQAGGTWTDGGYNAGSDGSCFNGGIGNVNAGSSSALGLGSLASNGGPTQTMLPLAGSPAIGLIPDSPPTTVSLGGSPVQLCPATDQRGYASAANTACDAGAVQTSGSLALATTADPAQVTLGSSAALNDDAVLSGGNNPGGTITFTLVDPSSSVVYTDTVPVSGDGTYTTATEGNNPGGAIPVIAGLYTWSAVYTGDNTTVSDQGGAAEQATAVAKASPTLTTTAGPAVVTGGAALSDSADLSGGSNPGGTITFTLTSPSNNTVYTDVVTVNNGNGTYSTAAGNNPGGFTPATAGIYTWNAVYSGDSGNNGYTASAEQQAALYGFGGFLSPLPKSTLQKSGSTIPVKFRLTNTAGQPISPAAAAALAAAGAVKATLTGPGISPQSVACTWNSTNLLFQCNIKTPRGLLTGKTNPYQITVYENVGGGFAQAPAVGTATNPETVFFK